MTDGNFGLIEWFKESVSNFVKYHFGLTMRDDTRSNAVATPEHCNASFPAPRPQCSVTLCNYSLLSSEQLDQSNSKFSEVKRIGGAKFWCEMVDSCVRFRVWYYYLLKIQVTQLKKNQVSWWKMVDGNVFNVENTHRNTVWSFFILFCSPQPFVFTSMSEKFHYAVNYDQFKAWLSVTHILWNFNGSL